MNLNLSSATQLTMKCGGMKKRTSPQCLHSTYNLSYAYRKGEWEAVWTLINTQVCKKLASKVLCLWEYVGETCEHVITHYKECKKFVSHVISAEKSDTTRYTISSHLMSLLRKPMTISHIHLLLTFVNSWWWPNFIWNKHIEPLTWQHRLLDLHMLVSHFAHHRDLQNCTSPNSFRILQK